jgi:hypothetical protein
MKISDLFTTISKSTGLGDVSKKELLKAVRAIIKARKDLGMQNNIVDLYVNACDVQDFLVDEMESIDVYLNIIFDLPPVQAYLKSKDIAFIDSTEDDESDAEDTESEESEESEDDSDSDSSSSDDDESIGNNRLPDNIVVSVEMPHSWVFSSLVMLTVANLCLTIVNTVYMHHNSQ